ncbi:MAG: DNA mismatch endonuclease Vsr [Pseudomonadota bacterium]
MFGFSRKRSVNKSVKIPRETTEDATRRDRKAPAQSDAATQRSATMRAVKSRDTGPELALRRSLHRRGFRYRVNARDLPGAPDIVLPKYNAIIFVHGCFWHQHDCARGARMPKTNVEYWRKKLARNVARDADACQTLVDRGWRVRIVWECELRDLAAATAACVAWLEQPTH